MNWIDLYKKHAGKWIALKEDEETVVAFATTAKAVYKKAKDKGYPQAFITRVPKTVTLFVGEMKYPYKKLSLEIRRPIIPIGISYKGGDRINTFALIDSGADICLFGRQFADLSGIPIRSGKYTVVTGISGTLQPGYQHQIKLIVGGSDFQIEAIFLSDENLPTPLLGQKGFFDKFKVIFDYASNEIGLKTKQRK